MTVYIGLCLFVSGRVQEQFAVTTNCSKEELHAVLLQCDAQCAEFRSVSVLHGC